MAKRKLQPVSLWGVEFDALIDESKGLTATIPAYPVEDGFPVSDTIINNPVSVKMTLYVSNTPVTWLHRHGTSTDRVKKICDRLEQKWMDKELAKIVTTDAIYKDMGITDLTFRKSKEIGYAREIDLTAQKVTKTKRKTVKIPSYILKSGETKSNAGTASVSNTSAKSGGGSGNTSSGSATSGGGAGTASASSGGTSSKASSSGGGKTSSTSGAKKSQSILYGVASGMGWI